MHITALKLIERDPNSPIVVNSLTQDSSADATWWTKKQSPSPAHLQPTGRQLKMSGFIRETRSALDSKGLHWLPFPLKTSTSIWRNAWCAEKIMAWDLYFCDHKNIPRRHLYIHPLTRLINSCFGSSDRLQKLVLKFLIWLHHGLWAPQVSHVSNVKVVCFTGTGSSGIHYYPLPSRLMSTCQRRGKR